MRFKFELPVRKFCDGDKKMVSMRLPEKLWAEVEKAADERGWNITDSVSVVLDQFCQWAEGERKKNKGSK